MVAWGQVIAYVRGDSPDDSRHGDSVVYLPRAKLTTRQLRKASDHLGVIARDEGRAVAEVRWHAELARFEDALATTGKKRPR